VDLKKVVLLLSVLCVLLAVVSGVLGLMLYSQRRFVTTTSTNPYIMFDTKTAQACWAGPTSAQAKHGQNTVLLRFEIVGIAKGGKEAYGTENVFRSLQR
jgi:hypothetical protein